MALKQQVRIILSLPLLTSFLILSTKDCEKSAHLRSGCKPNKSLSGERILYTSKGHKAFLESLLNYWNLHHHYQDITKEHIPFIMVMNFLILQWVLDLVTNTTNKWTYAFEIGSQWTWPRPDYTSRNRWCLQSWKYINCTGQMILPF